MESGEGVKRRDVPDIPMESSSVRDSKLAAAWRLVRVPRRSCTTAIGKHR
jgi:hypothetical protein